MAKITQHELAKQLGVSRSTVAAALNPASTIKLRESTRQRILEAAERQGYRPDHFARVMRGGRSGAIGMLHFGGLLQVAAERAFHAATAVRREGYKIVSNDLSWSAGSLQSACTSLLDARVEGVIVAGLNLPGAEEELARFHHAGVPLVTLSGNSLPWAPHFRGDTRKAIYDLTRHLLSQGHIKLSLITHHITPNQANPGTYNWAGKERLLGFETALKEVGGEIVDSFSQAPAKIEGTRITVSLPHDPFDPFTPGIYGMEKVLQQKTLPTAVICSNDEYAFGAMKACRDHGLKIPDDIAITGYDNTTLGRLCEVPLTTVRQPSETMAEAAVVTLLRMMEGETISKKERLQLFPCEVIIRESSGVPR